MPSLTGAARTRLERRNASPAHLRMMAEHAARQQAQTAAGYRIREARPCGVTFAECCEIVTRNGFTVSAGSYEDERTIQVFSVEMAAAGMTGEPEYAVSFNKAARFLSAG